MLLRIYRCEKKPALTCVSFNRASNLAPGIATISSASASVGKDRLASGLAGTPSSNPYWLTSLALMLGGSCESSTSVHGMSKDFGQGRDKIAQAEEPGRFENAEAEVGLLYRAVARNRQTRRGVPQSPPARSSGKVERAVIERVQHAWAAAARSLVTCHRGTG